MTRTEHHDRSRPSGAALSFLRFRRSLKRGINNLLPRSLYGRAALILLVPVVTVQLVVSTSFIQRLYEGVTIQMTDNLAVEIDLLLDTLASGGDLSEPASILQLEVSRPEVPVSDRRNFYDLSGKVVTETLHARFPRLIGVDLLTDKSRVHLSFADETGLLDINFSRRRVSAANPHQLLVLMTFTSALMTFIAYFFLRSQLRPIRRLALAAEAFGKGNEFHYSPGGADEVRTAGESFLDMRARIERAMEQRTMMLSGVSHDLRTPLTRLRLALSLQDETEDTRDMLADLTEMEQLIDAFLDFARADATGTLESTDMGDLVTGVVAKACRARKEVTLAPLPEGPLTMKIHPLSIARSIENLVGNAVRYGKKARVTLVREAEAMRVVVEDDGPGIPPELHQQALKPFARLDAARNQNKGSGVGLGLSIAADIALSHGGELRLGTSEDLGGLKAEIVLPM